MDSKPKVPQLPDDLQDAVETVIRTANKHKYVIIGCLFTNAPLSITLLRNTTDDPGKLLQAVTDMVVDRLLVGNVVEKIVTPVN